MDATRLVLDAVRLDADYLPGDIGWEFWRREGDAFPARTIDLLKHVDAALFGAVTSKPTAAAEAELVPELKGRGLSYRSPVVRMRQLFDLYVCLRPCKAYPGNPLNFREGLDLVVFRENTEDLYAGVEFSPVPPALSATLAKLAPAFSPFQLLPADDYAVSCKINTRKGIRADRPRRLRVREGERAEEGDDRPQGERRPRVRRALPRGGAQGRGGLSRTSQTDEANVDAICMWLLKNPASYDVLVAPNLYGDIISDLCAQMVGGLGFAASGNIGEKLAVFEPSHGSAPKYAGQNKVNPIATILAAKMMLDWLGEGAKGRAVEAAVAKVLARRQGPDVRHGRRLDVPRDGRSRRARASERMERNRR